MTAPTLSYRCHGERRHGWLRSHFSRWHVWLATILWLSFSGLTLLILLARLDHATQRPKTVVMTVAGTVLGPMTGAICRDFQGCCLRNSLTLMPWCLGALAVGVSVQLVVPRTGWVTRTVRGVAWVVGLLVWFGGGIVSFAHALS
jgi:hypothetical protein